MSFVSIPATASTAVAIRVTKIFGSNFPAISQMSVRPTAKGSSSQFGEPHRCPALYDDGGEFRGRSVHPVWNGTATESGAIQGLGIFLDPPYTRPTGSNVKVVPRPRTLPAISPRSTPWTSRERSLSRQPERAAFVVPANINNIFLGPGAWLQGKLRFTQSGVGNTRKIYGPGVLDVSRFNYANRHCGESAVVRRWLSIHFVDSSSRQNKRGRYHCRWFHRGRVDRLRQRLLCHRLVQQHHH